MVSTLRRKANMYELWHSIAGLVATEGPWHPSEIGVNSMMWEAPNIHHSKLVTIIANNFLERSILWRPKAYIHTD